MRPGLKIYLQQCLSEVQDFLWSLWTAEKKTVQQLRNTYPDYFMSKNKIELTPGFDLDKIFNNLKEKYKNHSINTEDGLKIDFENDWVHLRSSNTEPIIRIYAESNSQNVADNIAQKLMKDIQEAGVSNQ